ncbi:MAG: cell division protein FtsL [Burkholderiales bacterium]|jgi:cell division protein FtsL|nr:cell division protein FtsL [Burkholderiales bacterium]
MIRLNLVLLGIVVACALGVVTSQHKARQLYAELQHAEEQAKNMNTEYGQLQLEQSTWSMHARIEKIASERLQMKVPEPSRIHVLLPADGTNP